MRYAYLFLVGPLLTAAPAAAQNSLTFSTLGQLPGGGRYGMGYCQDPDAFYMAGGGGPASAFNADVYRYDLQNNNWAPVPTGNGFTPQRFGTAALPVPGQSNSLIYLLNGATASATPMVDVQTVNQQSGAQGPSFANPTPASAAGVAVWNGLVYSYGGQLAGGTYTNQLRVFSPATNAWTTLAPMPEAKSTYGAAVNGKIYVVGGFNGVQNSNRVDAYDIATNTWQPQGTLPTAVSNQAVAVQGEWLWLVGDFTNQSYLAAYNTRTRQLRTFTSNLPPRRNAAAAFFNNRLYVWGGNTASSNASTLSDMWVVNVSTALASGTATALPALRAYPNPTSAGLTTLALPTGANKVEVFDALGRRVVAGAPPAGTTTWPLDLHTQPAGMYLVRVSTAQGLSASYRVVRE